MIVVELFRLRREDAEVELLARIIAPDEDGPAVIQPADISLLEGVEAMLAEGVPGPDGRRLYLEDGEPFVRALPNAYRGTYLWADRLS